MKISLGHGWAALFLPLVSGFCALGFLAAGCAFNISHVKQLPATFTPHSGAAPGFVLGHDVTVKLGSSFPTHLKNNTRWRQVGVIEAGPVFATKDQIVTVEASHIYEAQLVVADQAIVGFYLPVDQKFVPVRRPIPIETKLAN